MFDRAERVSVRHVFLMAACCAGLGGCFPTWELVQPKTQVTVRDTAGQAVSNATLKVVTFTRPFYSPDPKTVATYQTDSAGRVSLQPRRKWVLQILLPDGTVSYTWGYCIEKAGFRARGDARANFREPIDVVLEPSSRPSRCEFPVKVVEE